MSVLSSDLRKQLEDACVKGRRASESACRSALGSLGVLETRVPAHLSDVDRVLRRGLRAKSRQLGDATGEIELLASECAFEQWHRLLFARFLAENRLLIHPDFRAPVTLAECEELAEELGEPDGWAVAGRFAAEILPGIFRLDDPCVQLRLAPEGLLELERIIADLPVEVFTADDALGWVYQFWQKEKKDEVNASERKIGGADLGPVTQLFTENYMVRFLLENSLGAWWAARNPDSPLIQEWEYLRFDETGAPAAGSFSGWPNSVAAITVLDPCCGSGHFLVEAFKMLWRMRAEEQELQPTAAQDVVLRDNLFGLELDPRCVQIAMFAVALTAWKAGSGWRELPVPHIACSGIPAKAPVEEWKALAAGDPRLADALERLHVLFREADTLGSLINPKRAVEILDPGRVQKSFEDVAWDDIAPLLAKAFTREAEDPATAVLGADAAGTARAADYLSRTYTLVATNVPYLERGGQSDYLMRYLASSHSGANGDLATAFLQRCQEWVEGGGTSSTVSPQSWLFLKTYIDFRSALLQDSSIEMVAWLGSRAFRAIGGEVVKVILLIGSEITPEPNHGMSMLDVSHAANATAKAFDLISQTPRRSPQESQRTNPDQRILWEPVLPGSLLADYAYSYVGVQTSDYARFGRTFWEVPELNSVWIRQQSTVKLTELYGGRQWALRWEGGEGDLERYAQEAVLTLKRAHRRGLEAWGKLGVAVSQMGSLAGSLYSGEAFDTNAAVLIPNDPADRPAIWAFIESGEHALAVRRIDQSIKVTNATLAKVPFDAERWRHVAAQRFPDGLPEPWTDDPTQWLFQGQPEIATESLHVALGRLLGFQWPGQSKADDLDELADDDGIVCLVPVRGERTAADRLQKLLSRAFGGTWSPAKARELMEASGSNKKDLESWLRDDFFKAHCQVFKNRPFIWQVWDGHRDGFSALVNYHRLDRPTLERLTYTYLGDWIERQAAGVRDDVPGAEERLAAARDLQDRLELILEGEPPYDIYVRWKSLAEQPMGWEPDLNDGVRMNVRPFVEAGVLRSKFNVKWTKDRGKNPDGTERLNDLHFSLAEKQAARKNVAK